MKFALTGLPEVKSRTIEDTAGSSKIPWDFKKPGANSSACRVKMLSLIQG